MSLGYVTYFLGCIACVAGWWTGMTERVGLTLILWGLTLVFIVLTLIIEPDARWWGHDEDVHDRDL